MGVRYTGLSKDVEAIADLVPQADFVDIWNDFVQVVKRNDHKWINPVSADSPDGAVLIKTSELSPELLDVFTLPTGKTYDDNYLVIFSKKVPLVCEQKEFCPHCWDEIYKNHKDFLGYAKEDMTTAYVFSYTKELQIEEEAQRKAAEVNLAKKKVMSNTLNKINLGELTPWAFVKGLENKVDYSIVKNLKRATEQEARLKKSYDEVTITEEELQELQKAYGKNDYTSKVWSNHTSLIPLIDECIALKLEEKNIRQMFIELEELRNLFGGESALERYMYSSDHSFYNSNPRIVKDAVNVQAGIESKRKKIQAIISSFQSALDFQKKPRLSGELKKYNEELRKFYAIGWDEAWGPLPIKTQ